MRDSVAALRKEIVRQERKPRLLFVSTRFLFPIDSGGKIRTVQILRGLKNGEFDVTLASPAPANWREQFQSELDSVCNRFCCWDEPKPSALQNWLRLRHVFGSLPIPVATDRNKQGYALISNTLNGSEAEKPDLLVLDFPHAAVLAPAVRSIPAVVFTHNVEAQIFARHVQHASDVLRKAVWRDQHRKMRRFEADVLANSTAIVAVSDQDAQIFKSDYRLQGIGTIRTGVDLDFFTFGREPVGREIVFIGSMDWLPNVDGLEYFLNEVWPTVIRSVPDARMCVVGKSPPASLIDKARRAGVSWEFTGRVDDVRPYVRRASLSIIPLRIAGGTRLKVYEAMALGCPVVSTTIGVEGLPLTNGVHYSCADSADAFAAAVVALLQSPDMQTKLSNSARAFVEENCSSWSAAKDFETICLSALNSKGAKAPSSAIPH